MKVAVTGASGYIGQRLVQAAANRGFDVLALSRQPLSQLGATWRRYEFSDNLDPCLLEGVGIVFHLAAATGRASGDADLEIEAASRLVAAARSAGSRLVFMSSQTAAPDAPTAYGRIKWRVERVVQDAGGIVVRPGQVYGGPERGLFGFLCLSVRRLPALPRFIPDPLIQPIHLDDLVEALFSSADQAPSTLVRVGSQQPIGFSHFLRVLSRQRVGRCMLSLPLPTPMIRVTAWIVGAPIRRWLGLDRLASLLALPAMDTAADLQRLRVAPRDLGAGMSRSGRPRRLLLQEARVLLAYVLREPAEGTLLRRYVRAIESIDSGRPLEIPCCARVLPGALCVYETAAHPESASAVAIRRRVDVATALAEASPQGAQRFLGLAGASGVMRVGLRIARGGMNELLCRAARVVLRPLMARAGRLSRRP